MDIFTDFDVSYDGDYYSGIPAGDGTINIFNGATVVDNVTPNSNGFVDGDWIFNSANIEGGIDTFVNGTLETHSQPNVFGGENISDGTKVTNLTIPNEYGGVDIYDENFQHEGMTLQNVYGSEDYLSSQENVEEILSYPDPLRQIQNLRFDPFAVY